MTGRESKSSLGNQVLHNESCSTCLSGQFSRALWYTGVVNMKILNMMYLVHLYPMKEFCVNSNMPGNVGKSNVVMFLPRRFV